MNPDFFVTGGTLARDTPCYVMRDADVELYDAISAGQYCYVLTSRQMGKSSLMVRAASQFRNERAAVAVLDLTAIGANVTVEQWYDGLLAKLGSQLNLEDELDQCWLDHPQLSPLQRWLTAIDKVVLAKCPGRIVIFIDEIDVVRSLPFPADEFFASIRQCYNRRSEDSRWDRLTICLLGVATPSELCRDPHITPFNIGKRIELLDFRLEEAIVLASGLGASADATAILGRVLYWTSGHPFLTQRLCREVASVGEVRSAQDVDRVCRQIFLSPSARERDDNLVFVRDRMLRASGDPVGLLDLYRRVYRREKIPAADNALRESLALTGVTQAVGGRLEVRNRIYRRVFDLTWIRQNMPDAEHRRQRAAYYRGLYRAAAIAALMVSALTVAFSTAYYQWRSAERSAAVARANEALAVGNARAAEEARQQAERLRAEAERSRAETEHAKHQAEQALLSEREHRQRAEASKQQAEDAQRLAEEAKRQVEQALEQAEEAEAKALAEKADAVDSRRRLQIAFERLRDARETSIARAALFAKVPDWLQRYYAEAVSQYADRLAEDGNAAEALKAYADACDLALAGEGFWVNELVHIEPEVLAQADVDPEPFTRHVHVSPQEMYDKVLRPAIDLGERELKTPAIGDGEQEHLSHLLAVLYAFQGRLIYQRRSENWVPQDSLESVVASYDRAIELRDGQYEYHVGRAVARFRAIQGRDLDPIARDLAIAVGLYPATVRPDGQRLEESVRRDLVLLHSSLGSVHEMMAHEAAGPADRRKHLEAAHIEYQRVLVLDAARARHVVAMGRTLRKQAALATGAKKKQWLARARTALERAIAIESTNAQGHNELGECALLEGDVDQARASFDRAVRFGESDSRVENRYRYLCNQANAWWRGASTRQELNQSLRAAQRALALNLDRSIDARFYQGLAQWSLAAYESSTVDRRELTMQALASFDAALREDPGHVGSLLARCQIIFESEELPLSDQDFRRAADDAERALALTDGSEQSAKAHYVAALGKLREHLDSQSEAAMVRCLELGLKAVGMSKEYADKSAGFFQHAERRVWKDTALKDRATALVREFRKH